MTGTVEYRDISGFPGYRIGNDGSVWSSRPYGNRNRPPAEWRRVQSHVKRHGYSDVTIRNASSKPHTLLVHRLVLQAFCGPCPDGCECRHLDGNRTHNAFANLAWGTATENAFDRRSHGTAVVGVKSNFAKLTESGVREIRNLYSQGRCTQTELAKAYCITQANISEIVRRNTWQHVV